MPTEDNNSEKTESEVAPEEEADFVLDRDREWSKIDRKRGILTKNDREFLIDQDSYEGQEKRNIRYRIRQRIIESLLDIVLITKLMRGEDLKQVATDERVTDSQVVERVQRSATLFAYDLAHFNSDIADSKEAFERWVGSAILQRRPPTELEEADEGSGVAIKSVDAEVDINVIERTLDEETIALFADKKDVKVGEIQASGSSREEVLSRIAELMESEESPD